MWDLETEFFRDAKEHENFIFAITVRMDVTLAFEDFD